MRTVALSSLLVFLALTGCKDEPTCPAGAVHAAWSQPPLSMLVPNTGVTICAVPEAEGATHLQYWIDSEVHDANLDGVDRAQNNGWDRTGDNWYSTEGDFNTPKWSTFNRDGGPRLRMDVAESGGGAIVDVRIE